MSRRSTTAISADVDPTKVAVSGGSYGGGESWTQASQSRWTFPREHDPEPDPEKNLPVLDLQVAVPKYPWTDLAYSLAPNGHGGGPALEIGLIGAGGRIGAGREDDAGRNESDG